MDRAERIELATSALAGYVNGPDAPIEATNLALEKVETAQAVILVEGISDQMAVEALAVRRERDLDAEGVAVLPIGGAQAVTQYLQRLGPNGAQLRLAGLCDIDAVTTFRRGITRAGVGHPQTTTDLELLGFYVCVNDLEDELIRAVTPEVVVEVVESQGELGAFTTFQNQPEWRGRPTGDQLHRFLGSRARRSLRYARLLIEAVALEDVPGPLDAVLAYISDGIENTAVGSHAGVGPQSPVDIRSEANPKET